MNLKETKFLEEYLAHGNATKAALSAGYSVEGSKKAAVRLLNRPEIATKIEDAKKKSEKLAAWNLEKAVEELEKAAGINGVAAVGEVRASEKVKAIELICRLKGLFASEKVELKAETRGEMTQNHVLHVPVFAEFCENMNRKTGVDDVAGD
jgi:hypothetical protein